MAHKDAQGRSLFGSHLPQLIKVLLALFQSKHYLKYKHFHVHVVWVAMLLQNRLEAAVGRCQKMSSASYHVNFTWLRNKDKGNKGKKRQSFLTFFFFFLRRVSISPVGSNGTSSSLSELLDEELRATACTPPTSQRGNQLFFTVPCCSHTRSHKIRSRLLTEWWKKASYCLTSLLKRQQCVFYWPWKSVTCE